MARPNTLPAPLHQFDWSGLLRLWPLHVLLVCAAYVLGGPIWQVARLAWAGSVEGGVQVDTAGASGHTSGGRFKLNLPVDIINGGEATVLGVSFWVETYGCPSATAALSNCRRLTAFEQYLPARVNPGSASSHSQTFDGVAPAAGEVLRIERRLQAIDDTTPSKF